MKRTFLLILGLALWSPAVFGQETDTGEQRSFVINGGLGLSFGLFDGASPEFEALESLLTLASVRGGIDGAVVYRLNDWVAVGPQIGLYALQYSSGSDSYTFIDLPIRAVATVGSSDLALQPYVGYYLSTGFPFPGFEVGARAILGSVFVEGSYVLGSPQWRHIALGFAFNKLYEF